MVSDLLTQYDVVIFDCDGVIVDVNLLKCEAFGKTVEGYPSKVVNDFVSHCKMTFGVSRYIKFKEFFSDYAKKPFNEEEYNRLLNKYSIICNDVYKVAKITPGCEILLSELFKQKKNLYVASGSDEKELNEIFKIRGLSKYFKGVFGSPKNKLECATNILKKHLNKKAVFIGDAISDMKTAKQLGIDFIYMSNYTVQSAEQDLLCRDGATLVISTLEELRIAQ
ncbi:HAD family hydrolase [Neobacillus mesonae]|uniref:HAD family hydrolase n=1 Tax=Neobacillus mesonae TaxID=1193713 RepID=UPI002E1C4690|nr:HAD hydrolase-like protein [Neobacillus mesonae]